MNIQDISAKVDSICDIYVKKYDIQKSDDWFLLKLQEELGELVAAHLSLTQRGRSKDQNLEHEIADVFAFILLFARQKNIDIEKALQKKWYKYLDE